MRFLLDTHTFLWWIGDDNNLSKAAREIISNKDNEVFLSTASVWEISIKSRTGKLIIQGDLEDFLNRNISENSFKIMPITLSHSIKIQKIPNTHRDPFDQMLAAQSICEDMLLITRDSKIAELGAELIW